MRKVHNLHSNTYVMYEAKAQRMRDEINSSKSISYNEYEARMSRAMGYGYDSYCGN